MTQDGQPNLRGAAAIQWKELGVAEKNNETMALAFTVHGTDQSFVLDMDVEQMEHLANDMLLQIAKRKNSVQ